MSLTRWNGQVRSDGLHKHLEGERVSRQSESGARPRSACEDHVPPHKRLSEHPDARGEIPISSPHRAHLRDGTY